MCGICGIFKYADCNLEISENLMDKMLDVIVHRGPDDSGIYINNKNNYEHNNFSVAVGLGHRRLSIIDLVSGHQPLFNEDQSIAIVFNGEIYNFLELREDLIKRGHKFITKTDTETIVHLYEECGEKCIDSLNGMFAFAIWDSKEKTLLLARDRVGKKPLYYYLDDTKLIFASEIKSILQVDGIPLDININALDDYLSFLCIPAPKTIFKKIYSLPAGHYLISKPDKFEVRQYWDVDFSNVIQRSEDELVDEISRLLHDSVQKRLISDVPLGAFLSGGIDSSAMVSYMAEIMNHKVLTNSIGFMEKKYNELEYAKIVAEKFNTIHHEFIVKPNALELLDKLVWHFDEPFADASAIPTYYVSKMAKENVTVAISGDGGDELFAGYQHKYYLNSVESKLRNFIPGFIRRSIFPPLSMIYPKGDWLPQSLRGKYFIKNLSLPFELAYFRDMSTFLPEMKKSLYTQDFIKALNGYSPFSVFEGYFQKSNTSDPLSKIQYVDIKHYLCNDILVKVDRMSMANSLEVRSPLLDYRFIEFIATIPSNLKLNGKDSKYIFKKTLEKKLPSTILSRKKKGFTIPLASWFRNEIKEFTDDILFSNKARGRGYFNYDYIFKIWNQHLKGSRDFADQLWILLILELWHRKYMD